MPRLPSVWPLFVAALPSCVAHTESTFQLTHDVSITHVAPHQLDTLVGEVGTVRVHRRSTVEALELRDVRVRREGDFVVATPASGGGEPMRIPADDVLEVELVRSVEERTTHEKKRLDPGPAIVGVAFTTLFLGLAMAAAYGNALSDWEWGSEGDQ